MWPTSNINVRVFARGENYLYSVPYAKLAICEKLLNYYVLFILHYLLLQTLLVHSHHAPYSC